MNMPIVPSSLSLQKLISLPILLFLVLLPASVWAKDTTSGPFGKARIQGIDGSGYYRLPITPELQKHCLLGSGDLRIHGPEGKDIPYLLEKPPSFQPFQEVRGLKILNKKSLKKGGTVIRVEDSAEAPISAIALEVDQGTISRSIQIEASDDGTDRKLVHPAQRYHDERYPDGTRRFVLRDLDLSGHRFYRVRIGAEGRGLDPRILEASVIRIKKGWESYSKVPVSDLRITQKENRTYVRPVFNAPSYRIDGIDLKVGPADYFYRRGFLARGDPEKPDSLRKLASFDIISHGATELRFDGFRSKNLLIVLKDGDLPPLSIEEMQAYQRDRALLFRSDGEGEHELRFGQKGASILVYELPHFREQMPDSLNKASIGKIRWNGPPLEEWVQEEEKKTDNSTYRVLTTIGIILIWLFGVSVFVAIGLLIYRRAL